MVTTSCCRLTIFEGADGSGKTTAARQFAEETGARYVHFGAFPRARHISRFYAEAMLPALLGYQDVVFDRSWYDEAPYGRAFRNGHDRVGTDEGRMLARLAMRCGVIVVVCSPPWEVCRSNYASRKHIEYLENEQQLKVVYDHFAAGVATFPFTFPYDYTRDSALSPAALDRCRFTRHPLAVRSAGNWLAPIVLVGEKFAEPKEHDPFYQWPFASFSDRGCSRWLTRRLDVVGVQEYQLLWVNADQDLELISPTRDYYALGDMAAKRLTELGVPFQGVPHPQAWKRFHHGEAYPLTQLLMGEL